MKNAIGGTLPMPKEMGVVKYCCLKPWGN